MFHVEKVDAAGNKTVVPYKEFMEGTESSSKAETKSEAPFCGKPVQKSQEPSTDIKE